MLNELVEKLYNERWNICFIKKINNFKEEDIQILLDTPSKNKNLLKWRDFSNRWYHRIELTNLGIRYFENWFKFDREIEKNSVNININENHWNVSGINNWSQNINNQIDEIIKLLNKKEIDKKEEIILLLEEYKKTEDKNKIVDIFTILWSWASINSMLLALSSLISW